MGMGMGRTCLVGLDIVTALAWQGTHLSDDILYSCRLGRFSLPRQEILHPSSLYECRAGRGCKPLLRDDGDSD
jgi:hypothetical protein